MHVAFFYYNLWVCVAYGSGCMYVCMRSSFVRVCGCVWVVKRRGKKTMIAMNYELLGFPGSIFFGVPRGSIQESRSHTIKQSIPARRQDDGSHFPSSPAAIVFRRRLVSPFEKRLPGADWLERRKPSDSIIKFS